MFFFMTILYKCISVDKMVHFMISVHESTRAYTIKTHKIRLRNRCGRVTTPFAGRLKVTCPEPILGRVSISSSHSSHQSNVCNSLRDLKCSDIMKYSHSTLIFLSLHNAVVSPFIRSVGPTGVQAIKPVLLKKL